jgi:hypothetical protein
MSTFIFLGEPDDVLVAVEHIEYMEAVGKVDRRNELVQPPEVIGTKIHFRSGAKIQVPQTPDQVAELIERGAGR